MYISRKGIVQSTRVLSTSHIIIQKSKQKAFLMIISWLNQKLFSTPFIQFHVCTHFVFIYISFHYTSRR